MEGGREGGREGREGGKGGREGGEGREGGREGREGGREGGGREGGREGRLAITPLCVLHADENLNFAEQILEAVKNIASATSTLAFQLTVYGHLIVLLCLTVLWTL